MSQLSQIQDEILRRFKRPRTVDDIPGYAGGSLGEQLDREGQSPDRASGVRSSSVFAPPAQTQPQSQPVPTGQVLTPTNQANITRPRSVFAPPQQTEEPQPASPQLNGSPRNPNPFASFHREDASTNQETITRPRSVFEPSQGPDINAEGTADFRAPGSGPVSMTRDRHAEPRDYVADDSQYLRDLENKPRNWKDKVVDVVRAANQAFGSNPKVFTPTKREREELETRGMLGQDIAIQKEQTAQQLAQMVPIYDAGGNVIGTAPRRTSAATQIRATDTGTRAGQAADRLTEMKRRNDAYISHVDDLPGEKRADAARKIWLSGVADGNDELKADLAQRMGLKEKLPDSDKGTVQTDASGNFTIVHPRDATAETVTDKATGTPKQSWVITKEQRVDDRARRSQAAAMQRTLVMAQAQGARLGNPEDLDTIANEAQANADIANAKAQALLSDPNAKPSDKKLAGEYSSEAGRHRAQAIKAREAASKARSGQNFTAPQSQAPKKYNSLDEVIRDFKNSPKNTTHRDPTANELNVLKQKYGVQ